MAGQPPWIGAGDHLITHHQQGHGTAAQLLELAAGAGVAVHHQLAVSQALAAQPFGQASAVGATAGGEEGDAGRFQGRVRRRSASRYFSAVRSMISAGSSGAGGCLFQPIDST